MFGGAGHGFGGMGGMGGMGGGATHINIDPNILFQMMNGGAGMGGFHQAGGGGAQHPFAGGSRGGFPF